MQSLDFVSLAHILPRLLSNTCPSTVPRSGSAGAQINCFVTTVRDVNDPELLLLRMVGDQIEAAQFDGDRYSVDVIVPLSAIDPNKVHLTHFYGTDEVRYQGVWAVARGLWTGWPYAWIHLRRLGHAIAPRLFNRRTLTARRRLQVLREVVEATTNGATAVDAMDLMTSRYGTRWASHPEWQTHHQQLDQQFKLLVESGELRKHDHLFQPTGQALRTLDESEKADRKHTANYRIQLLLALLTLVSAVMAAAQAGLLRLPVLLDLTPVAASAARASVTSPATASPWWPASTTTNASAGAQPRASAPIPIVQPGGAKADTSRGAM